MKEQIISLEFKLKTMDFDFAGEASSNIKQVLQRIGVVSSVVRRIAIGTYEAEMNAIIHAKNGRLRVVITEKQTQVTVEDDGPGIPDIDLAMTEGYSTASDQIREMGFGAGMGLPNMAKCADEFLIESRVDEGTKLTMTFYH